jgi:hypothetical protein
MNLHRFQEEVNNLVFLYYNAIGIIQRDFNDENIQNAMSSLSNDLKECKNRILEMLEDEEEIKIINESERILEEGNNFVNDAFYFIDKLVGDERDILTSDVF